MRLGEKFKHEFKWHLLTAFLMLVVIEIFNDRISADRPYHHRTADCLRFARFVSFSDRLLRGLSLQ